MAGFFMADPYETLYVPHHLVETYWPLLERHIAAALEHSAGEYLAEDLLELIAGQRAQLWGVVEFAGQPRIAGGGVTQVCRYPRRIVLQILAAGGRDFDAWQHGALLAMQRFAAANNCSLIRAYGRKGWARKLAGAGFTSRYQVLERSPLP